MWHATVDMKCNFPDQCSSCLLLVGGLMSYLRCLYLFAYSDAQHIVCFCFVFLRLVYPMLPVSLDCPFLIAPSVFSGVYFQPRVTILSSN